MMRDIFDKPRGVAFFNWFFVAKISGLKLPLPTADVLKSNPT